MNTSEDELQGDNFHSPFVHVFGLQYIVALIFFPLPKWVACPSGVADFRNRISAVKWDYAFQT